MQNHHRARTLSHRTINWAMRNIPIARRLGVWGDDLLGYGQVEEEYKWWYDLEEVDGTIQIPPKSRKVEFYEVE